MTAMKHASQESRRWRRWLWLLAPLGLALVTWQAAEVARQQALQELRQDADNELRLSAAGLTGHLSRHDYLPRLLASREAVRRFLSFPDNQDSMPLNHLLDHFRAATGVSDIYLLDRHANTLAASNWHRPNTFIGQNYAFRSYYRDAIAGRGASTASASSHWSVATTFPLRSGWTTHLPMPPRTASWWLRCCSTP